MSERGSTKTRKPNLNQARQLLEAEEALTRSPNVVFVFRIQPSIISRGLQYLSIKVAGLTKLASSHVIDDLLPAQKPKTSTGMTAGSEPPQREQLHATWTPSPSQHRALDDSLRRWREQPSIVEATRNEGVIENEKPP